MQDSARSKAGKVWQFYLMPGFFIGGIKFLSVFTWFFYQPVARVFGLSSQNPGFIESAGTLAMGLIGACLAMIGWPVVVYMVATGSASPSEMLFYPWVVAP
jgi:hypothetical protein